MQDQKWFLPRSYLLLLHNKCADIISSLFYLKMNESGGLQSNACQIGETIIQELANLMICFGQDAFSITKTLEGLIAGEIISTEEKWDNQSLLEKIQADLAETGYTYKGSGLQMAIQAADTPLRMELGGFMKCLGHPIIDPEGSCLKVYRRANKPLTVNCVAITEVVCHAKRGFIEAYIYKHGQWPPVVLGDGVHQGIVDAQRANKSTNCAMVVNKYGEVPVGEFMNIEIGKCEDLNRVDFYMSELKDRVISKCEWMVLEDIIGKERSRGNRWEESRLLLVYLMHTDDEQQLSGFLDAYMSTDMNSDYVLNYMVMKLVPKEKEMGALARIFGIQTHQARYKKTVQESNAMHYLDNYCKDQTMTLDSLQLAKRLQKFRALGKVYQGWRILYVNFDVSGWCSNFRDETVTPVVKETLDKFYGVSLYEKTQLAYEQTMYTLPGTQETYGFRGLAGGIEGLNQYTWMSVYTTQMRKVLGEEGLQFHVLSYGDDYKAALLIPPHQVRRDIQVWKDMIVKNVTSRVKVDFGHNMKEYESYGYGVFFELLRADFCAWGRTAVGP